VGFGEERGVEGFLRFAGAYLRALPDMLIQVQDTLADGDRVVHRLSWTGRHRGAFPALASTGRRVRDDEIVIMRIADGKIAEGGGT
jgi:predicted ester cyclase